MSPRRGAWLGTSAFVSFRLWHETELVTLDLGTPAGAKDSTTTTTTTTPTSSTSIIPTSDVQQLFYAGRCPCARSRTTPSLEPLAGPTHTNNHPTTHLNSPEEKPFELANRRRPRMLLLVKSQLVSLLLAPDATSLRHFPEKTKAKNERIQSSEGLQFASVSQDCCLRGNEVSKTTVRFLGGIGASKSSILKHLWYEAATGGWATDPPKNDALVSGHRFLPPVPLELLLLVLLLLWP